jgi:hypothetical protein
MAGWAISKSWSNRKFSYVVRLKGCSGGEPASESTKWTYLKKGREGGREGWRKGNVSGRVRLRLEGVLGRESPRRRRRNGRI